MGLFHGLQKSVMTIWGTMWWVETSRVDYSWKKKSLISRCEIRNIQKKIPPQLLTMQWWPRGTAWQSRNGAWAAANASSSSSKDAAASSDPYSASASSYCCCPVQLLFDLLQAGALLEARHPIDHSRGHVSAGARGASVGVDGKDVAGATEGANGHPATVQAKTHVLDLRKYIKG